jgi:hypothetical protein
MACNLPGWAAQRSTTSTAKLKFRGFRAVEAWDPVGESIVLEIPVEDIAKDIYCKAEFGYHDV